jgi:phospho-N-acetylmuramoyl-pentapeptide-transferase
MAAMAFLITIVLGYPYLNYLRRAGYGKKVRIEGPSTHIEKTGTPTMGGLLVTAVVLALTVCLTLILYRESGRSILLPMGVMALTTLLGWYDDRMTLVGRKGEGMRARTKFALLGVVALIASFILWDKPTGLGIDFVYLPGVKAPFVIGWWVIPLSVLAIIGTSHAVNLTDGLDSLAGHTAAVAYAAYGIIAAQYGQIYLVTFCFTVAGALLAFLWFNAHPAEVFMGDSGSLALGATLAVVAMMLGQVLLLLFIGLVFVAEALSVMLQVVFFKLSGGRRLFRMAPLHHHFEMIGWAETTIVIRFWLISALCAALGLSIFYTSWLHA